MWVVNEVVSAAVTMGDLYVRDNAQLEELVAIAVDHNTLHLAKIRETHY